VAVGLEAVLVTEKYSFVAKEFSEAHLSCTDAVLRGIHAEFQNGTGDFGKAHLSLARRAGRRKTL
jgi:hypothetical protein